MVSTKRLCSGAGYTNTEDRWTTTNRKDGRKGKKGRKEEEEERFQEVISEGE